MTLKTVASLIGDARVINYYHNMFIIKTTGNRDYSYDTPIEKAWVTLLRRVFYDIFIAPIKNITYRSLKTLAFGF